VEVSRAAYQDLLSEAVRADATFQPPADGGSAASVLQLLSQTS
jgi:hypothetical protein